MIAVTALEAMSRLTFSMARFSPYQIETFFASKVNFGAGSALTGGWAGRSTRSVTRLFGCWHNDVNHFQDATRLARRVRESGFLQAH